MEPPYDVLGKKDLEGCSGSVSQQNGCFGKEEDDDTKSAAEQNNTEYKEV